MHKKVINTQGREIIAYSKSADLSAGNSFVTLAKIPGSLRSQAGLMLTPALRPEPPFIPNDRDSLSPQRMIPVLRSEVRGLPLSTPISAEPPFLGTVSLFN